MKRPLQNILAVAGSDATSRLLGFATNAYLARVLGVSAFGIMSIGFSVLSYAVMLSSPGVQVLGTRDVAANRGRADTLVNAINSMRVVLALVCVCVVGVVAWLFIHPAQAAVTTFLFSLSAIPAALSLDWYFQGKENLLVSSGSKVIVAFMYVVFVLLLVQGNVDVVWTAVAFFVANIAATGWLLLVFRRSGGRFHFEFVEWRSLLQQSFPLGISSFLAQTIMNLPVLIVGGIISQHDAGLFNAAMKLIFAALMIDRVFYAMFFPVIARQRATDMKQFKRTAVLALKVVLAVSIPIVVAGNVFAIEVVEFVYGAAFLSAAVPFQLLLLYFLFSVMNSVVMSVMIVENREGEYLHIMASSTAILVLLCVILAFTHGLAGAAAAVALGEGVMTVLLFAKEKKYILPGLLQFVAPAVASGVLMLGVLLLLRSWSMVSAGPGGLIVFYGAFVLLKGISKEDVTFLRGRFV